MTAGPAWPAADENTYRGRADELRATLRSLTSTCEQWEQQRAQLFNGDLVWSGDAATAGAAEVDRRTASMHTLQDQLRAAATQAGATASVIIAVKNQVTENVETAQQIIDQINNTPGATPEQKSAAIEQVVTAAHATNVEAVTAGVAQLGTPPAAIPLGFGPPNAPPPNSPKFPKGQIPPPATDPVKVKQWWDSQTLAEQQALVREHPDEIGALKGVPCHDDDGHGKSTGADRDTANQIVMHRDIERVRQAAADHHVSDADVTADPEKYGLTQNDITRYNNGLQTEAGLNNVSRNTNGTPYLYQYDPAAFRGKGSAVIAIGDPDGADNTVVVVPGTGNSVSSRWLSNKDGDGIKLYNQMVAASKESGQVPCAMLYMGIDTPDSPTDPRIATNALARSDAPLIAGDVNALRVTHDIAKVGDPHITVSGHSYGSTAVADAAAGYGMRADDIVLLGCPGTDMAHNAADFHLPDGGHVYVGAASGDPISHIGEAFMTPPPLGLGADPAIDGFGSTRFKAEFSGIQFDHSHYYDLGSESLYSLTTIAGGNGEALQDLEMTAPHRSGIPAAVGAVLPTDNPLIPDILERPLNQIVTGMAFDPETTRPATGGHQYGP